MELPRSSSSSCCPLLLNLSRLCLLVNARLSMGTFELDNASPYPRLRPSFSIQTDPGSGSPTEGGSVDELRTKTKKINHH